MNDQSLPNCLARCVSGGDKSLTGLLERGLENGEEEGSSSSEEGRSEEGRREEGPCKEGRCKEGSCEEGLETGLSGATAADFPPANLCR